jgi:6-phosphofructokinase 1
MLTQSQFDIPQLGAAKFASPLFRNRAVDAAARFVSDDARVLMDIEYSESRPLDMLAFQKAGAREHLFFEPSQTRAAIVTCGGLCPGLNNIIRNAFFQFHDAYGVKEVLGLRFGYEGLNPHVGRPPVVLTHDMVERIHHQGGTILGTSRGPQDTGVMVDFLKAQQIDILLCVGGDGTLTGAHAIAQEIKRRGLPIAVVGIPKTIDNDIQYCYRTFGFVTAVEEAEMVIDCAHTEAKSVLGGVGLVKLMGREAGFIAAAATIASGEVNFTLVPEVPFELNGPQGLLGKLERRLDAREHAVIVVAEGAGQHLLTAHEQAYDKSGNRKLGDIGPFLKGKIIEHFARVGKPVGVKYFDPSYNIRSVKANAADSLYCEQLARQAVHAGMAGKTDLFVGLWHNHMVHVPLEIAVGQSRRLDPQREMWAAVLATTGQENW